MRFLAVIAVVVLCFLSAGCGPELQPPQQGYWSNFHDKADQSTPAPPPAE